MVRRKLHTTFPNQSSSATSPSSSNDVSPSIMITVLILAIAVILSASLYLLLRFLRRNRNRNRNNVTTTTTTSTTTLPHSRSSTSSEKSLRQVSPIIDTLPLFTYDNLAGNSAGDCAVCLSKFEKNDVLRLLPICCHAFHAECIDTWLNANFTCPLCRSPIFFSENDVIGKLAGEERSRSFRVEIGNVSNRQPGSSAVNSGEIRRSYSLGGSFDYVISAGDDAVAEVTPTSSEYNKEIADPTAEERGVLAAEVGTRGGGAWLKDYLYSFSSSSRTSSFRGSGRFFFTGSSRRSTVELPVVNRENELAELDGASRLGDEIGELFRWLSGA